MLTYVFWFGIINKSSRETHKTTTTEYVMERYRSGHNEAVLKTVCPQGRVGSNPTLSVIVARSHIDTVQFFSGKCSRENKRTNTILCVRSAWRSTQEAEGAPLERE